MASTAGHYSGYSASGALIMASIDGWHYSGSLWHLSMAGTTVAIVLQEPSLWHLSMAGTTVAIVLQEPL